MGSQEAVGWREVSEIAEMWSGIEQLLTVAREIAILARWSQTEEKRKVQSSSGTAHAVGLTSLAVLLPLTSVEGV